MSDRWRSCYPKGSVVRVAALDSVGRCWAHGRLVVGDIVVVGDHAGDCFHNHWLVRSAGTLSQGRTHRTRNKECVRSLEREATPPIGAYALGPVIGRLTDEEYHDFMGSAGWAPIPLAMLEAEVAHDAKVLGPRGMNHADHRLVKEAG